MWIGKIFLNTVKLANICWYLWFKCCKYFWFAYLWILLNRQVFVYNCGSNTTNIVNRKNIFELANICWYLRFKNCKYCELEKNSRFEYCKLASIHCSNISGRIEFLRICIFNISINRTCFMHLINLIYVMPQKCLF